MLSLVAKRVGTPFPSYIGRDEQTSKNVCNMAKVQPKTVKKVAAKAASATDTKAAEKADRLKLIEAGVPNIASLVSEYEESRKNTENIFFSIGDAVREYCEENGLEEKEGRELIKLALAEAGGFDATELEGKEALKKHPREYSYLSKIQKLAFPIDSKHAKELEKARKAGVTIEDALKIARGNATAAQVKVSGGKGKNSTGTKATGAIEDEEALKNAFAGVISKAKKGGFEIDDIETAFADTLSLYAEDETEETAE